MYFSDYCFLCTEVTTLDGMKRPQKSFTKKGVYCNNKGVKRNEFYQAHAQGYKPELCIYVKACDFNNETHVDFKGIMYRIIRTYPVKNECIEIIAQSPVAGTANG